MITEADKFQDLQGGWQAGDPGKSMFQLKSKGRKKNNVPHGRLRERRKESRNPHLLGGGSVFSLFRPSTNWMRPTHSK